MGEKHLSILINKFGKVVLCSADAVGGKALAEKYGCKFYGDTDTMLACETIDYASVCTPTPTHKAISISLLKHKIPVLCEKPFALTREDAEAILNAAEENGTPLMVAHCARFSKANEYLKRCVNDKRFGKLLYLKLFRHSPIPRWSVSGWLHDTKKSGGIVMDLHIHDTDVIRSALGMPTCVKTVSTPLSSSTIYGYEDCVVSADATWRLDDKFVFESGYDAFFEEASVRSVGDAVTVTKNGTTINPLTDESFPDFSGDDAYDNEITYFINCIEADARPDLCLPSDSLDSLSISLAEIESANIGACKAV